MPLIQPRVETNNNHGTGCTLSAAIATGLGQGMSLGMAVRRAQKFLNLALRASWPLGEGSGPPHHFASVERMAALPEILAELEAFRWDLAGMLGLGDVLPGSRTNVVRALPWPDGPEHVAGFVGGLVSAAAGRAMAVGSVLPGASRRTAAFLSTAMRRDPDLCWCAGLRWGKYMLQPLEEAGFTCVECLAQAPDGLESRPGAAEEWLAVESLDGAKTRVDIVICKDDCASLRAWVLGRDKDHFATAIRLMAGTK